MGDNTPPVESDSWCRTTSGDKASTTFTWTIEDFFDRPEKNGEFMSSSSFTVSGPNDKKTTWKLKLYPRGDDDDDSDYDTLVQTKHQPTVKPQEKMAPVRSPRSESSAARHQPSSDPPFLLVSSSGLAADQWSQMFGLYRKTTEITEDRSVYIQEHDTQPKLSPGKLFSDQGVWTVTYDGRELLRATTPSENPTSIKWKYKEIESEFME